MRKLSRVLAVDADPCAWKLTDLCDAVCSYEDAGSKQDPRQLDLETMRFVFASMDRDGDGLIVFKDLTEELSSLPLQADLFQLSEMFMQHAMKSKNKEPAMDVRSFSAMLPELQRMYKVLRGHPEGEVPIVCDVYPSRV